MKARAWKLGATGLGALTLACAGMSLPTLPQSAEDVAQLGATVVKGAIKASDCNKLSGKVSFEEEHALGGAVALKWVEGGKGLMLASQPDKDLEAYLNVVGKNLAAQSSRPTLPWTFGVLKDAKAFNAASAPGGYVFVTRGLLKGVENEAQLAGVLAHEIAHVTLQHALSRYDKEKVSACQKAAAGDAGQEFADQTGFKATPDVVDVFVDAIRSTGHLDLDANLSLLTFFTDNLVDSIRQDGFPADDEFAADKEAVHLMLSAGYAPEEYLRFIDKLPDSGNAYAHHPTKAKRHEAISKLIDKAKSNPGQDFPEHPTAAGPLQKPALPPVVAQATK